MALQPENIEIQENIMRGANAAYKKLVVESAGKNQKLVIADKDGNILHVPAKDLLKDFAEK